MLTANDFQTVHEFVKATGEANIKKMMVGGKMTNTHVGLLLKLVRNCKADEFAKLGETSSYPKIKFSNEESALKETFWATASATFVQLGLVTASKVA